MIEDKQPTHIFNTAGTHTIRLWVANNGGCWSANPKEMTINIPANKIFPQIDFQLQSKICYEDDKIQFQAREVRGLAGTFIYTGKGVSETGLFDPAAAGVGVHEITYTFTSSTGCTNTAVETIEVLAMPIVSAPQMISMLSGGQVRIEATAKGANLQYKWSPSDGLDNDALLSPVASPAQDTEYTLTVTVEGRCSVLARVFVKVLDEVRPPNSFSPNGDGINDVWNIEALSSYTQSTVEIFNRNGQKVFMSKGYLAPFDGTYQRKPLPVGVYYYRINPNNGRRILSGSLTLIR
ncbi:hypothetical protein D9M68_572710 [compost metagenome]